MAAHLGLLRRRGQKSFRGVYRQLPSATQGTQAAHFSGDADWQPTPMKDNVAMKNLALRAARGGRSSVSGIRATVFGSTGFMGRYVVNRLGQIGSQVVLPHRWDQRDIMHMKLMGDLGQIIPVPYQIRDPESVSRVLQGSNVVVNLMGVDYDTWNYTLHDVHVNAVELVCKEAIKNGVDRFIHISAAGAAPDSDVRWLRTKWQGEQVVKQYYPEATIIRPSLVYGVEDRFTQQLAQFWSSSIYLILKKPWIYNGFQQLQPVAVEDVALAVLRCIQDPVNTCGKTYSLFGDNRFTRSQLMERFMDVLEKKHYGFLDINPDFLLPFAKIIEPFERKMPLLLRGRPDKEWNLHVTADQLRKYKHDFVPEDPADIGNPGLRELGISPLDFHQEEIRMLQQHYHESKGVAKNDYWNQFRGWNYRHCEWEPANHWWGQGPHPENLLVADFGTLDGQMQPDSDFWNWIDEDWEIEESKAGGGFRARAGIYELQGIICFWSLMCLGMTPMLVILGGVDGMSGGFSQHWEWMVPFLWDAHPTGIPWREPVAWWSGQFEYIR